MKYSRKTFIDRQEQKELIKFREKERAYVEGSIPKTGRSYINYSVQLFPDIQQDKLLHYLQNKDYLDVACGINHLYPDSLLCKLQGSKKRHGVDIHSSNSTHKKVKYFKGSIYNTGFSENSYDCITINNFMYFWESNPQKLFKMYQELYKLIRKNGTIRIFPVFYGNYYCDNVELYDFLNTHFTIQCLRPVRDYSKESPIYLENQTIKKTDASNGINEYKDSHELMAHVLILRKLS
jgi:hypothetical protein